jgi:Fur family ferric uptake transcriptional regulator
MAKSDPSDTSIIQPLCAIFRRFLKKRGLKFTAERASILDAVLSKDGVFEVDQLMFEMHQAGHRVSKATIYRTIKHLVESGIIQEVLLDSRQAHYQLIYGRKPMDHLVCMETGDIIEFHNDELAKLRDRIARDHGYKAVGHRFLIYGVSPEAGKSVK